MALSSIRTRTVPPAWRFALVGALASLPVTVVLNWLPDSGGNIAGGIMIFGAFIAGFIAATRSVDPDAAGFRAGLLSGVVGILTPVVADVSTAIENTAVALPSPFLVVAFVLISAVMLSLASVFGLACGHVGGWAASKVATRRTASAS